MYYKRVLYESEKERYNSMPDKDKRSVYVLLKYWIGRPKKWNKLWNNLSAVYKDDSEWEYLVANHLEGNGLDWTGEYVEDEQTGDEYIKDPTKTWITSELGKKRVNEFAFKLGYKKTLWQILKPWYYVLQAIATILALIISIIALNSTKDQQIDYKTNQELEHLKVCIDSIAKQSSRLKDYIDYTDKEKGRDSP